MTDKGYFDSTTADSVATGDFMYWNSKSRVALVTRYDGYTIEYSQHFGSKQDKVYHTLSEETDSILLLRRNTIRKCKM